MYYSNIVISYLQTNKILAIKLERAVSGIEQQVSSQVKTIGAGVTRTLYYTSCFTDEYQDVCKGRRMRMLDLLKVSTIFYSVMILYMKCFKYILKKYLGTKQQSS